MSSESENSSNDSSDSEIEELGLQPYQFEPEYSEEEIQNEPPDVDEHGENNENRLENSAW